jgi:hypothetical protein
VLGQGWPGDGGLWQLQLCRQASRPLNFLPAAAPHFASTDLHLCLTLRPACVPTPPVCPRDLCHLLPPQILYSDSLRQACTPKSADPYFLAFTCCVAVVFSLEAAAGCLANPRYAKT